jgi:predicted transcriptional regulator
MRAQLLMGLERWLENSRMTQAEAAKVLGVTQARVSDLKRGKINRFSILVGAIGRARWTQTQTETRGVRGQFIASGNVRRQPPFGGGITGGIVESVRFY